MTPKDVIDAVVSEAGIGYPAFFGARGKARRFARARQLVAFLLRSQFHTLSYAKIAKLLGYRDHRSVSYAVERLPDFTRNEPGLRDLQARVTQRLGLGA